jgi:tetratricopeptide (TPR) repeat protein
MKCPKCGYDRQTTDNAPDGECPACGIIYAKYRPSNQSIQQEANSIDIWEKRYKALIGERNQEYYLTRFKQFDQLGTGLKRSWNWPAFFFNHPWFLYRKMYGWFFAFSISVPVIFKPINMFVDLAIEKTPWAGIILLPILLTPQLLYGFFGNSLYHKHIKKKIAVAQLTIKDEAKLLEHLGKGKGVNRWVIWVGLAIPVFGILAAIIIPQFSTNSSKQTENQQTSSIVSEKPDIKHSYLDEFDLDGNPVVQAPVPSHAVANPEKDKATEEHFNTIRKEIPGFDKIVASGELVSWIDRQPSPTREQYKKVAESGTASEVIELLNRYKSNQKVVDLPKQELRTSDEWLNKAIEFVEKEDWPGLIKHALRWTKAHPEDASAWYNLGVAYGESNQPAKAIEAYQQALRINPESDRAWCSLGFVFDDTKQLAQAIEAYQQSLRINPETEIAWFSLGNAYNNSNQLPKAIEAYQRALRINPEHAVAWYNLGNAYSDSNQLPKAIEAYQQALRINPELADAWSNLGNAYSDSNQLPKAIEAYQQALRINPELADAWSNLGNAYRKSNQFPKAIEAYQRALRINPEHAVAWYNLGNAYKIAGQDSKVMEVYKRLKTLDPAMADRFFNNIVMPQ